MLYMGTDGTIWIDDRPEPPELKAAWPRERAEEMRRKEERHRAIAAKMAMLEAAIAEHEREIAERERIERELAAETAECDELVELVELAEESAMVELEQLGCIAWEPDTWEGVVEPPRALPGSEDYRAWSAVARYELCGE